MPLRTFKHTSLFECLGARKGLGAIHWDLIILSTMKQTQSEWVREAANMRAGTEGLSSDQPTGLLGGACGWGAEGAHDLKGWVSSSAASATWAQIGPSSGCVTLCPSLALSVPWVLLCTGRRLARCPDPHRPKEWAVTSSSHLCHEHWLCLDRRWLLSLLEQACLPAHQWLHFT